ncbi:MAG: LemA family protein [Bryobacter sp.]|nr:LemA family protein [Bryobacter sp.]
MKAILILAGVVLVGLLAIGAPAVGSFNSLTAKRNTIEAAWANVDVALQRRADLIPNLVETVKGFAAQEKEVYESIAQARAALSGARTPAEKVAANGALDSALSRLLVIVENYPQLRSNENFQRLQDELAGTENRIAVERRRYNDAVQDYNTTRDQFPANILAGVFGFARNDAYFKADPGSRAAPKVDFQK